MKLAAAAKVAIIAVLALALLVPVLMIQGLVHERQAYRNEVVAGIAEGWGKRQTVAGPYLQIAYERHWTEIHRSTVDGKLNESRTERSESHTLRLPVSDVEWTVNVDVDEKARGIHKARLYSARLDARGSVSMPGRSVYEDGSSRYKWGTPLLVLGIADPVGIRSISAVSLGEASHAFNVGPGDDALAGGLHAPLEGAQLARSRTLPFSFTLELAGLEAFSLATLGADAAVAMRANWPHPSFQGRFLPAKHAIAADGFSANWKVSRFATQGARSANCGFPCSRMGEQVSVSFVEPAGLYQQLERASKYGFLFIGLTFAAFLLVELLRRLAIHPIQYALVGLALAMFFLLLTALSEHVDFTLAYAAATLACVGLVSGYLVRVLKSARLGLAFGGALAALYAMLYALLKAEDYSLLGGALLLFALLAVVMLATRRVDWYALSIRPAPSSS